MGLRARGVTAPRPRPSQPPLEEGASPLATEKTAGGLAGGHSVSRIPGAFLSGLRRTGLSALEIRMPFPACYLIRLPERVLMSLLANKDPSTQSYGFSSIHVWM